MSHVTSGFSFRRGVPKMKIHKEINTYKKARYLSTEKIVSENKCLEIAVPADAESPHKNIRYTTPLLTAALWI